MEGDVTAKSLMGSKGKGTASVVKGNTRVTGQAGLTFGPQAQYKMGGTIGTKAFKLRDTSVNNARKM